MSGKLFNIQRQVVSDFTLYVHVAGEEVVPVNPIGRNVVTLFLDDQVAETGLLIDADDPHMETVRVFRSRVALTEGPEGIGTVAEALLLQVQLTEFLVKQRLKLRSPSWS